MIKKQSYSLEEITSQLKHADGNIVVEAGAGTGKTYNLTNRILYQISGKGISLDQILAMTFTDYAAAEMRERVYSAINEAIGQESDDKKRGHLIRQKRDFSRNHISTFHSFCNKVLRYYPDEAAGIPIYKLPPALDNESYGRQEVCYLDAGFEILGSYDEILLKQELLKEFYKTYKDLPSLQAQLNMLRYSVLEVFLNKLSSKEDADLLSIARMQPEDYIANMKSLLEKLNQEQQPLIEQAWNIIKENRHWFKKTVQYTSWEDFASKYITKNGTINKRKCEKKYQEELKSLLDPLLEVICENRTLITPLKDYLDGGDITLINELRVYRENDTYNPNHETYHSLIELADISLRWTSFLRYKRVASRTLNFDDIIWFTRQLFKEKPEIADNLGDRFRYIMIDEFQDTDDKQWEIVKALTHRSKEGKVLIVGDIKQAIYGFRGGDVTMMDKARKDLKSKDPDAYKTFSLFWSFRSNETIINFVNALFDFCFDREEDRKPYMATSQRLLRPTNGTDEIKDYIGEIRVVEGPDDSIDPDELGLGSKKILDNACWLEALRIADFLNRIRQGDQPGYERITNLMDQGQCSVGMLFRRRTHQHVYEQALRLYELPFTVSSGRGFFKRQEIMDCHNLLAFLQDAFDDLSLAGVLRSPFVGLSDAGLLTIRNIIDSHQFKSGATYWQTISNWEAWGDGILIPHDKLALSMVQFLKNLRGKTPYKRVSELLSEAVFDTNFLNGYVRDPQAKQNVIKLIDIIRQLESAGRGTIFEIVEFLRIQMEAGVDEADAELPSPGIIQLMTVHGSKGLQFPMVVLPDMSASSNKGGYRVYESPADELLFDLPLFSYNPKDREGRGEDEGSIVHNIIKNQCKQREAAELIRLFYVAATRAESHLLLGNTKGCVNKKATTKGSFSNLFYDWDEQLNDLDLFVSDKLSVEKIDELVAKVQAGFNLPKNGKITSKTEVDFAKLKQVSGAASYGVSTVTDSDLHIGVALKVFSQWKTISAADAGTIIHRAIEINPCKDVLDKLLGNLIASLGYPNPEKVVELNHKTFYSHIINASSCLKERFGNAPRTMKEVHFEVKDDNEGSRFVRGTIDMLIQDRSGKWNLIDFKTAMPNENEILKFSVEQGYLRQLQIYQKAFCQLTKSSLPDDRVFILFSGYPGARLASLQQMLKVNHQHPSWSL